MQSGLSKLSALVADPSNHMTGLIAGMLRGLKLRKIHEVVDSTHAMTELRRHTYNVLIVDDALDGMDGIALTRMLRADADCQSRHATIIMMSAMPDAKRIAAARDAGVTEFLRKPFSAKHIEQRLISIQNAPREFIAEAAYIGPDRRRHGDTAQAPKRRAADRIKSDADTI